MTPLRLASIIALCVCPAAACVPDAADAREQEAVLQERLERYDAAVASKDSADQEKPVARWVLPNALREISGLVLMKDGRLLAHGDETAEISEIDYKRGVIVKHFLLGDKVVRDDFEGITRVNDRLFMMTSEGLLYEFNEGEDRSQVPYVVHDTHLTKECEMEGVTYDSTRNALILPCKVVNLKSLKDHLVLYRWSLDSTANPRVTHVSAPLSEVIGSEDWKDFHPSDITIDPGTGNYVIVAAQEKGLIVVTPDGRPVSARTLDDSHNQVEGVAITSDGILILSDEVGKSKPAAITLDRWRSEQ